MSEQTGLPKGAQAAACETGDAFPDSSGKPGALRIVRNSLFADFILVANTASQLALAENIRRSYLLVQNRGTGRIYVSFGKKASSNGFQLMPDAVWEPQVVPYSSIHILGEFGTERVVLIEGTQ